MKPFLAPLHRLHRIYARSGADIPVSTLSDWTASVGALVGPLVEIGSVWATWQALLRFLEDGLD